MITGVLPWKVRGEVHHKKVMDGHQAKAPEICPQEVPFNKATQNRAEGLHQILGTDRLAKILMVLDTMIKEDTRKVRLPPFEITLVLLHEV
jgi:hypothetical protein